ncbi:MAG: outer membrane beta-barrel protein [Deltaproteobacteria bacterium]|nr:outer membrane beta-barrel protein [Deltaproteobacteria bacterium]
MRYAILASLLIASSAFADESPFESGLAIEPRLTANLLSLSGSSSSLGLSYGTVQGGLVVGYHLERFTFGLGVDLARFSVTRGETGSTDHDTASTSLTVSPVLRAALLRSADNRVELIAALEFGFGHVFTSDSEATSSPNRDTSNFTFGYLVGPGLRYWLHPQLALQLVTALRGQFVFTSETTTVNSASSTSKENYAYTNIATSLGLMGVF